MKKILITIIALSVIIHTITHGGILSWIRSIFEQDVVIKEIVVKEPDIDEIAEIVSDMIGDDILGGSLVATRYGGIGTSSADWTGLVRVTSGVWASTSEVTDAEVPDDITITNIPNELSFSSTTHDNLRAGTTTFFGPVDSSSSVPTIPTSTTASDDDVVSDYYLDTRLEDSIGYFNATNTCTTTIVQATTSGFLMVQGSDLSAQTGHFFVYSDANPSPSHYMRADHGTEVNWVLVTIPIEKDHYYYVATSGMSECWTSWYSIE